MRISLNVLEKIKVDKHLEELIKGSSAAFILRLVGIFINYIFMFLVARFYGAEIFGFFSIFVTLITFFSIVGKFGLEVSIIRAVNSNNSNIIGKLFFSSFLISLIISFLALLLSDSIANFIFNKNYLSPFIELSAIGVIPIVMLFLTAEYLRAHKRVKEFIFIQNLSIPIFGSFLLLLIYFLHIHFFGTRFVPVVIYITSIFISLILSFLILRKSLNIGFYIPHLNTIEFLSYLKESYPVLVVNILNFLMTWINIFILELFTSEKDVGIFNLALRIALILNISLVAVGSISAPKFAELWYKKDLISLEKVVKQSSKIIYLISIPLFVSIVVFSEEILSFFGKEFKQGIPVLLIILTGQLFSILAGNIGNLLNMTENQHILRNTAIISALLNILLSFSLVQYFGVIGAAISTAISISTWNILCIIFAKKKLGFHTLYLPWK